MTERERLPERGAPGESDTLAERVEDELREPLVPEGRAEAVPHKAAERINWPLVLGLVATVAVVAAVIYALLITWSAT
jgi:hypothetical protein